jgi:hypothetical protein
VERALFLGRLSGPLPGGFDRLYFGAEFCPWLLPSPEAAGQALEAAHAAGLHFTLATPVLLETTLAPLRTLLERILPRFAPGDELLVSDLGALESARAVAPGCPVVLGRVLSGQKRGPQILDLELTEKQRDYFRGGAWYATEARRLLAELDIHRVELDNLLQGIEPLPEGLAGSLHYPFAMVASSRNCPFRAATDPGGCPAECGEAFQLTTPKSRVALLQAGNTQFLRNDDLPEDPLALGIDRLVWHPGLPR